MCVCSGVAKFWRPALVSQWLPLTEITILKNDIGLLNFPSFVLITYNLKISEKSIFFSLKIFIFAHITIPALCRPGLLQHWRPRLSTLATTLSTSINFNCIIVFFRVVLCNCTSIIDLRRPLEFESAPNHCLHKLSPERPYGFAFIVYQSGQPRISKLYMLTSNAWIT
jgi:hypothetical protein